VFRKKKDQDASFVVNGLHAGGEADFSPVDLQQLVIDLAKHLGQLTWDLFFEAVENPSVAWTASLGTPPSSSSPLRRSARRVRPSTICWPSAPQP
jgi:hypothetical protein